MQIACYYNCGGAGTSEVKTSLKPQHPNPEKKISIPASDWVFCRLIFLPVFFFSLFSNFLFITASYSQILTNYPENINENIFSNNVFFSEKFIRQNKIKKVMAEISFKRELQPIVKTGNFQGFEFNQAGQLIKQMETISISGNVKDTSVSYFNYNEKKKLELKRSSDGFGFYSYYYEYDDSGNMVKQVYSRDENRGSKNNFELSRQYIINSETYQYEPLSPRQKKMRFYNDNGMEYKSVIFYFNDYGNLSEEESRFVVTDRKSRITYKYDEFFRLTEKTDFSSVSGMNKIVSVFTYDEYGNVLQEKISRNGTLVTTREFLYDKATFLLDAQLIKDEATQTINIYKYSYEF